MRILFFVLFAAFSAHAESFRICEFAALPTELPMENFKHTRNHIITMFEPFHLANDTITTLGHEANIAGKFSYGLLGKDLEDEVIEIWIDDCRGDFSVIHRAVTDADGRISWSIPGELVENAGQYRIWMRVAGDNSGVFSTLRVLAPKTKIAVFDVDGTLTTREDEIRVEVISELVGGNYSPPKRDYASELTNYLHDRLGYEIVYLSGRHYFLTGLTRSWLARYDFAPGTVILAQSLLEVFPTDDSVGSYKLSELTKIMEKGLLIRRAYGNATTDIFAYKKANVVADRIFIVGKFSGTKGTVALGEDFYEHYKKLFNGENV